MKNRNLAFQVKSLLLLLTAALAAHAAHAAGVDPPAPMLAPWMADKLAVQLYSFHSQAEHDIAQAMHTIRDLGFKRVELYPVAGVSAAQMHDALRQEHLHAIGAHIPLGDLDTRLSGVIADAKLLGLHQVGVPWIKPPSAEFAAPLTIADVDAAAKIIAAACKPLHTAGIRLYIHAHGFEFAQVDGKTLLRRLFDSVGAGCLSLQVDVFWAASAGVDPAELMHTYRGRVTSIHLKDRRKGSVSAVPWAADPKDSVVLGTGNLNVPEILKIVRDDSIPYLIIEDESPDSVEQIRRSLRFLGSFH